MHKVWGISWILRSIRNNLNKKKKKKNKKKRGKNMKYKRGKYRIFRQ